MSTTTALFTIDRTGEEHLLSRGLQHLPALMAALASAVGIDRFIDGQIVTPPRGVFAERMAALIDANPVVDVQLCLAAHLPAEIAIESLAAAIDRGLLLMTDQIPVEEYATVM